MNLTAINPSGNGSALANRPEVLAYFTPPPCTDRLVMADFSKQGKWIPEHETAPPSRERLIDTLIGLKCANPERGAEPPPPEYVLPTTDSRPDALTYGPIKAPSKLIAKPTKRGDRYHWHAARCTHAINPNEYTIDRVLSDKDFANAFRDERCISCHAQFEAK